MDEIQVWGVKPEENTIESMFRTGKEKEVEFIEVAREESEESIAEAEII